MMIPSRRKLGAAALIIAGIGAFLVPFLLHSPATQGTSSNNGGNTNPNNGTHPTNPNPNTCSAQSSGHSDVSEKTDKSSTKSDASDNSKGNLGHAYGLLKHQMDTTVAMVKSMGTHNSAFHAHHDTKTDNATVHNERADSESSNGNNSSCAEKEETGED